MNDEAPAAPRLVYELHVAIPELGARPGDAVVIKPGRPIIIVREHGHDAVRIIERHATGLELLLADDEPPASAAGLGSWLREQGHADRGHLSVVKS